MAYDTLNTFVNAVQLNLGNRSDLSTRTGGNPSRIDYWLWDSYKDLAFQFPFPELESTVSDMFQPAIDTYNYPPQARSIVTVSITGLLPSGINGPWPVRRRDIKVIRRYNAVQPGPPSVYAPYGAAIIVRPIPDQAYPFNWDIRLKPNKLTPLWTTQVWMPDDWNEILVYLSTLRGHISLLERDKAGEVRQLLYGDPKQPQLRPGLIKQKAIRYEMENIDTEYAIRPLNRRMTQTL